MDSIHLTKKTGSRARFKYVVCFPSTREAVRAFNTLKAARDFAKDLYLAENTLGLERLLESPIPIISRESIEKYNLRKAGAAA